MSFNIENTLKQKSIDYEQTIKRGFNICENNRLALQNRYQLLKSSLVRSASLYSDMPHNPNSNVNGNEQRIIKNITNETDSLSNYMNFFKKLSQNRNTHYEGYFLYKYYVMGIGKETIFEELEVKSDKRKRKAIQDNAYLLVALATNSVIYQTETIITFELEEE